MPDDMIRRHPITIGRPTCILTDNTRRAVATVRVDRRTWRAGTNERPIAWSQLIDAAVQQVVARLLPPDTLINSLINILWFCSGLCALSEPAQCAAVCTPYAPITSSFDRLPENCSWPDREKDVCLGTEWHVV
jgi:hypothetical protein